MKRHAATPRPAARRVPGPSRNMLWAGPGMHVEPAPEKLPRRRRPRQAASSVTPRGPRPTRRQRVAAAFALVLFAAAGLTLALSRHSDPVPAAPAPGPRILAPKDASLSVAGRKVEQMPGSCDAQSCFHVPPTKPVVIESASSAQLPVTAGQSTLFTVGAYNLDRHNQPVPVSIQSRPATSATPSSPARPAGSDLVLDHVRPGRYQVTVSGQPNGGMWQFTLVVKK